MPQLIDLPIELILRIAELLNDRSYLNAWSQTCASFDAVLKDKIYRPLLESLDSCDELSWAAENGKSDSVRALLAYDIPPDTSVKLPDAVSIRLTSFRNARYHPILRAAENGHLDTLKIFVEHGVDPNPIFGFVTGGPTPVAKNPLLVAITGGHEPIVQYLIERDALSEFAPWKNSHDLYHPISNTPLAVATREHQLSIIKLLLESGCSPHAEAPREISPIAYAVLESWEVFKVFIDAGVDTSYARDPGDAVPARWALTGGNEKIIQYFFDRDPPPTQRLFSIWLFQMMPTRAKQAKAILERLDIDTMIESGDTEIIEPAVLAGREDILSRVIEAHNNLGKTCPLEDPRAIDRMFKKALQFGHNDAVRVLLNLGAEPGMSGFDRLTKRSPLYTALVGRRDEIIKLLLARKTNGFSPRSADSILKNRKSLKALRKAIIAGEMELVSEIVKYIDDKRSLLYNMCSLFSGYPFWNTPAYRDGGEMFVFLFNLGMNIAPGADADSALVEAVERGDIPIVECYVKEGYNLNKPVKNHSSNARGRLLLAVAAEGHADFPGAAEPMVDFLLKNGAKMEWESKGLTPIHQLVATPCNADNSPRHSLMRRGFNILLEKGANPLTIDKKRGDSLIWTATVFNKLDIVRDLLAHFDKKEIPFDQTKDEIKNAASLIKSPTMSRVLESYYCNKVHPCPQ
ncbi:hypothetical protein N7456_011337 [Penicillium angulare]|uniref:F-box domain-containing protein n=1 Tax=Penicillium angulare TaxID=116970 RepID=A0A9W9K031_9EURO|nr:hypothetical protein N7456_011337 [Penicillium angulare]